jgi:hypothetical protein
MQRAQAPRSSSGAEDARSEAAAAAALVAPVVQLDRAASDAGSRLRFARCLELYERALAAAEGLPLPHDSLVVAFCVSHVVEAHTKFREDVFAAGDTPQFEEFVKTVWRGNERALSLAQRCLALYHTRWRAGTLFTLKPEESAFLAIFPSPLQACAEDYISQAQVAIYFWPPLRTPAEEQARLHAVYGALRTALEMDARPDLRLRANTLNDLHLILVRLRDGGMLHRLQSTCGLSHAELTALIALAKRDRSSEGTAQEEKTLATLGVYRERAATDVARHGLRRCALPSCNSTEPHPKCYKLCGRCRGVAYCGAPHCAEDWKRHKREDGCRAAP